MTKKVLDSPEKSTAEEGLAEQPSLNESAKAFLDRTREEEKKMVTGRFRCYAIPGSAQKIQVKKYKEIPLFDKEMVDGCTYTIPLWVARHLNGFDALARFINSRVNSCAVPVHQYKVRQDGSLSPMSDQSHAPNQPSVTPLDTHIGKYDPRMGFESLDFGV